MTDHTAINTRAKENMMFQMASMPQEQRVRLSYGLMEMVRQCSFNGQQCNITQ
jgi:hypothetical protein